MSEKEKKADMNEEPKVGVYICHCGGNISDHVDVEKVEECARCLPGVTVARRNPFMCSDPGQEMIMEDIRSGKVNRVVVASCAPSLHETTFRGAIARAGLNQYLYDHANIREQVSWVHHGRGATGKASSLVSAAVAKARHLTPLQPIRVEAKNHATVIGGGVAGLKAAHDLSARGIKVTLVEKTPFLGGNTAALSTVFPTEDKAGDLLTGLAGLVLDNPDVQVLTCAEVTDVEGYVGNFSLKITRRPPTGENRMAGLQQVRKANAGPRDFIPFVGLMPGPAPETEEEIPCETGAIIMATGFRHYVPFKGEYGYGTCEQVVTLPDLIRMMEDNQNGDFLKFNNRPVRSMAIIHCVGSREIPGIHEPPDERPLNEYCSRVCCTASLQAANFIKTRFPETAVYELFRDIRTYGRGHEEYYLNASRNRVTFVRFAAEAPPRVSPASNGDSALTIEVADTMLAGEALEIPVDLVVLAVGMEPENTRALVEMLKLPVGADRFLLEVHPKLRPVEMSVSGVLLAGTAQAPMDITEATAAASASAAKAASILARGYVELDPFVAGILAERCTGCGQCVEACIREGAVALKTGADGAVRAEINPAMCQGCGVCVASCPEDAIQVNGWTLQQFEAMVGALAGQTGAEAVEG